MAHVEHLISAYYDGELSARRRRQVEAHLEGCAMCRARLSEMERLSDVLAAYELPDTLTGAETFRAQVALRLARRARRRAGYMSWAWHLVPLGLLSVLLGILGLLAAADLLRGVFALAGWTGVDVLSLLGVPDIVGAGTLLHRVLFSLVGGLGGLMWRLCAYLGLLFVFAVYVGWVGALWRARTRP
jgi:anti-sigma factor RsiW